jgi:hypothetical protein
MSDDGRQVRVGEVVVDLEITEGIGPLSPEEVRALVAKVMEEVRRDHQARDADRARDTTIRDRVFEPRLG